MGVDAEMFARIKGRENWLKDESAAAQALADDLGRGNFWITNGEPWITNEHGALSIVRPASDDDESAELGRGEFVGKVVWFQDGPEIVAGEDEQFVQVHMQSRYYGPDYERGDWPFIKSVAAWLERRFPGCEVWYGGDSSGICAEHLTAERLAEIDALWSQFGNERYRRGLR